MRNILSILFLIIGITCNAQISRSDSLKLMILEQRVENTEINLAKAHDQYRTGLHVFIISAITTTLVTVAASQSDNTDYSNLAGVYVAGSAGILTGSIMMLDSHKYIGRAGKWRERRDGSTKRKSVLETTN